MPFTHFASKYGNYRAWIAIPLLLMAKFTYRQVQKVPTKLPNKQEAIIKTTLLTRRSKLFVVVVTCCWLSCCCF
jgi:hypothetical protein